MFVKTKKQKTLSSVGFVADNWPGVRPPCVLSIGGEAGGGRGGCSRPKRKFGAENIASGSVKVVCQDIPSSDLFTNRFNRIVFGEVKCCRTFNKPPLSRTPLVEVHKLFRLFFDVIFDIGDYRAYILCSPTTKELPKKHHEVGSSELSLKI